MPHKEPSLPFHTRNPPHLAVPALADTVDESLLGEWSGSVHRLTIVLWAPGGCKTRKKNVNDK